MRSSTSRRTGSAVRRTHRRTAVESLEGRTLLSTVVVNTTADSTDPAGSKTVSLRDAIAVANKATSATTITFDATVFKAAKTITLGGTQLELSNANEATTITGPASSLTISGNNKTQVLSVNGGVVVSLLKLVVTKGSGAGVSSSGTLDISSCDIAGNEGTGIYTAGAATVTNSTIDSNSDLLYGGGGISIQSGTVSLRGDTVSNNATEFNGGGIEVVTGTLTAVDTTVTGNTAIDYNGGGIEVFSDASATLNNVTIASNKDEGAIGGGQGGGIRAAGDVTIGNSIVAGNSEIITGPDVSGSVTSLGHNLIGKTDDSSGWTSADYTGTVAKPLTAKLGSLASNGGPTQTLLPLAGSPAIDKGSNSLIPSGVTTDQRGLPRKYNGTVDIGAVEVQPLVQITAPSNQTATQGVSKSVTLGSFTQYSNSTPFKDTISWGDGSAGTTLSLTAAGTIPATAHTFAKVGTFTVTETITDAKGNKSNAATFTVAVAAPVGSISGTVFNDGNGDGKIDDGEAGLGLFTVYLDLNNDGKLDTGDKSVTTDVHGAWSFAGLVAGTYTVRVVPVTGLTATKPTGGVLTIKLAAGQTSVGNLFGERSSA